MILLGAGGHAKVLLSLIKAAGYDVLGVCAPELREEGVDTWRGIPVLDTDDNLTAFDPERVAVVNGVGDQRVRQKLYEQLKVLGYYFPPLIHPRAYVDPTVKLDEGVQVMAGAVIQSDTHVGQNVIINTQASVDHDCIIEDHVHLGPGAVLCGHVLVKKGAFIGSGASVVIGIQIGEYAIMGAGVSIVRNIEPGRIVLPASVRVTSKGET